MFSNFRGDYLQKKKRKDYMYELIMKRISVNMWCACCSTIDKKEDEE